MRPDSSLRAAHPRRRQTHFISINVIGLIVTALVKGDEGMIDHVGDRGDDCAMTGNNRASSLTQLPFHERRYISVISDQEFDSRTPAPIESELANQERSNSIWPAVSLIAPALVPGGMLVRGALLAGGIAYTAYAARTDPSDKTDIKNIDRNLIVEIPVRDTIGFVFSTRYAEVGRVYAANPLSTDIYYPVQSYNDDMIVHKLSELELLLNALGAKRFSIKYHEDETDHVGTKLTSSTLPVGAEGALSRTRKRRFERSGTSDGREPSVPEQLTWYPHEPDWQALAQTRMLYGRKEFSFSVELEQGLELTAKAVAAFQLLGVDVGADYNRNRNLTLVVSGTF